MTSGTTPRRVDLPSSRAIRSNDSVAVNRPGAAAKAIRSGWYFTGDTGYIDHDGGLFDTGRKLVTGEYEAVEPGRAC